MITLIKPTNGEKIDLLTKEQHKFLESDRGNTKAENFDYLNLKRSVDEDYSFPKKIIFEWKAEGEGVLQISESETFEAYYSENGKDSCSIKNLKCGTRYFWRVVCGKEISEVFCFDTTENFPRFIEIDGMTNVRDCGGWKTVNGQKIRQGMLYRGSELNSHVNITDEGIKTMREVLKIKSVIDLRGETEIVEDVYKGRYVNIPVKAYSDWFNHPDKTREIFDFLGDEENYPVYFHCWGGADRTGTLAFIIGALLGQKYDDLVDDYEITSLSIWGDRSRNSQDYYGKFIAEFNEVEGEALGDKAKNYLMSVGISESVIEKIKAIMLS